MMVLAVDQFVLEVEQAAACVMLGRAFLVVDQTFGMMEKEQVAEQER